MTPLEFFRLQTRQEVLAHYDRFGPVGVEELDLADAGPEGVMAPDRVAVHGGPQEPRHVLRRGHRRGQDPAAGGGQIQFLHPHRAKPVIMGQDFLAGLQTEEF